MSDQNTGLVEVTQADREAAHSLMLVIARNRAEMDGQSVLSGNLDFIAEVQAFARHRIAAQKELS